MTSRFTVLISSILLLVGAGCATQRVPHGSTPIVQATGEIPQDLLLEIGIEVFDPGLPEQKEEMEEEELVFAGVRQAEARFIPYQLKNTLQQTGQWGAVRLVPDETRSVEVRPS